MIKDNIRALKNEVIFGKNINLRIASESDAELILELRLNPDLNKFINKTDPSVEKQRDWIRNSFNKMNEFHFIMEDKKGNRCGTIAIFDIDYENGLAEWGRWVIKPGSFVFFPVESTILILYFAFSILGLKKLRGGANNKNIPVVNFHKMYASISSEDETHTWFTFEKFNFLKILKIFKNFHNIELNQ